MTTTPINEHQQYREYIKIPKPSQGSPLRQTLTLKITFSAGGRIQEEEGVDSSLGGPFGGKTFSTFQAAYSRYTIGKCLQTMS